MRASREPTFSPQVFFPVVFVGVALVVAGVVFLVPPAQDMPTAIDEGATDQSQDVADAGTTGEAVKTDRADRASRERTRRSKASQDRRKSGRRRGALAREGASQDRRSASRSGRAQAVKAERWRYGDVTTSARVFLFDRTGESGTRRMFQPAPPGWRFAVVSLELTWDGKEQRNLQIVPAEGKDSTIQLRQGGRTYDPIGRLTASCDAVSPVSPAPVEALPGEELAIDVVFVLPESVKTLALLMDGRSAGHVNLPTADRLTPDSLAGVWRKSPGNLVRLRHDSLLIDAIARPEVRLLRFSRSPVDTALLSIPKAGVTGIGSPLGRGETSVNITLTNGDQSIPAVIRAFEGDGSFILYAGSDPATAFVFEHLE